VRLTTAPQAAELEPILSADEILALQDIVRRVPCADHLIRYAMSFARWTRREQQDVPDVVRNYVAWGAGPRASQYLVLAAKARAILQGRYHVSADDIRQMAMPVLRHRIITNFNAEAEGVRTDDIVQRLIEKIPVSKSPQLDAAGAGRVLSD